MQRTAWPFDLTTTLGLGVRLEPEQLWLYEQPEAYAMGIWVPSDPVHEAGCTEGCGYPIAIDEQSDGSASPLVIPLPLRIVQSTPHNERAMEEWSGETWCEWPTVIAEIGSEYHPGIFEPRAFRLWDVWPILKSEHDALQRGQDRLFEAMAMHQRTLLAGHEYGECPIYEYMEDHTGWVDQEKLAALYEMEDEQAAIEYLEERCESYMDQLYSEIDGSMGQFNSQAVREHLALREAGLSLPWRRLQETSKAAWATVANSVPTEQRAGYMHSQKWIKPWF